MVRSCPTLIVFRIFFALNRLLGQSDLLLATGGSKNCLPMRSLRTKACRASKKYSDCFCFFLQWELWDQGELGVKSSHALWLAPVLLCGRRASLLFVPVQSFSPENIKMYEKFKYSHHHRRRNP